MDTTVTAHADQARARASLIFGDVERRYRRRVRGQRPDPPIYSIRVPELGRIFADRYGVGVPLPDDDAGRHDLLVVAQAYRDRPGDLAQHVLRYSELRAPWLTPAEAEEIAATVTDSSYLSPDDYALELGLYDADRTRLRVTTIGSVDVPAPARFRRRKRKDKARQAAKRKAAGAKPHSESAARTRPWLKVGEVGVSKATYYRMKKANAAAMRPIRPQHVYYIAVDETVSTIAETFSARRQIDVNAPPDALGESIPGDHDHSGLEQATASRAAARPSNYLDGVRHE